MVASVFSILKRIVATASDHVNTACNVISMVPLPAGEEWGKFTPQSLIRFNLFHLLHRELLAIIVALYQTITDSWEKMSDVWVWLL